MEKVRAGPRHASSSRPYLALRISKTYFKSRLLRRLQLLFSERERWRDIASGMPWWAVFERT